MTRDQGSGVEDQGSGSAAPPRLADWILKRVLPQGKRGDSILGDLHEEFSLIPDPRSLIPSRSRWYWKQTLRLVLRYAARRSPQQSLMSPRSNPMWFDIRADFRTAFRMLQRSPGTSTLIVATLALAIGAATIGFAFADLALFRGLPVDDNSKVVTIFASDTHGSTFRGRTSAPDLLDYRARTTTLAQLSGMRGGRAALIRNGQSLTLSVNYATANVFAAMGQTPLLGRALQEGDDVAGAAPVAVLSHHYWRDEMDSRPEAIGRTLQIGRDIVTVVGVLKPDMEFGNLAEIDLWLPQQLDPDGPRDLRNLRFMGRLRDGVTFDQAAAEMAAIGDALANAYPLTNGGWKIRLVPIREITGGDGFWVVIALFLFSIGLLIAIATANVSNLIMVRAAARARELAVRTAMGAKGGRLFRQFLIEGFVLAAIGALLAVPAAWTGLRLIVSISPDQVFQQIVIDQHELAFVAMLALVCPVAFSVASARLIVRPDLREVLATQGGRGSTAKMRGRGALVVAQVALAVIMLTASSLAAKSIRAAFGRPLGISIDRLLIFGMEFNDVLYPDLPAARAAADDTREALAAMPGVTRATAVTALPILGDSGMNAITVDDRATPPGEPTPMAVVTGVRTDAMAALGVGLRGGSWWAEGSTNAAVISQTMATRYFDGVDRAIGRHFSFQSGDTRLVFQVIGVSTDVASTDRTSQAPARIWVPMPPSTRRMTFIIEGPNPAALARAVRSVAASVAPAVPIENLRTFTEAMQRAQTADYVIIATLGGFALVALLLASAGLFGVVSFSVSQRTAEFGTRMALGAPASAVVGLVVRQSGRLLLIGLTVGLAGGVAVGFAMRGVLFGTSPADPATLAGVSILLVIVSLMATAWPAWRASRIDPVIALRAE
jgi:putative ABC transport system permease protein